MSKNGLLVRIVGDRSTNPGPAEFNTRTKPGDDSPQWTIKNKYPEKIEAIDVPYSDIASTIGEGPKISMHSRPQERALSDSPGPNYIPPSLGSDAPKVSMTSRHDNTKYNDNPGPGAYDIKDSNNGPAYTLKGRTESPDASTASPGPAAYNPNYNATMKNSPSPTMHGRPTDRNIEVTPGPSDYAISRDLGGPQISMHIRPTENQKEGGPGPGAYSPQDLDGRGPSYTMKGRHDLPQDVNTAPYRDLPTTIGEGPKISMHSRPQERALSDSPGPNYIPPSLGSDAPKVSMTSRHDNTKYNDNPGPGAYDIKDSNNGPAYTLKGRTESPDASTASPGPAAYNPNYNATMKNSPSPTMHGRPTDRNIEVTPGPSDYAISRDLGGPQISMHIRPTENQKEGGPGPGAYSPQDLDGRGPSYTMKGRHDLPQDVNTAPYRDLPTTIGEGPKISMHSRPQERALSDSPGPNYIPPSLGSDAPKVSMTSRHDNTKYNDNPGPGAYDIKDSNNGPAYTLKGRTESPDASTASPGPAAYNPNYNATMKNSPSPTMHGRPTDRNIEVTPGPSDYAISRDLGGPQISMHIRPTENQKEGGPGPGAYSPQDLDGRGPSYTM
ncbi:sperm-tail PG-rich repeat-containing protein, partial [Trichomonas vaginalis G3]|uniref:sperm-tail PG-rich repeat-containing protein n=1 Tax=Trichomonas vaginalis (strain ATCC PRA-98 / G3) TaxID=412133 RepID=UPI0021E5A0B2